MDDFDFESQNPFDAGDFDANVDDFDEEWANIEGNPPLLRLVGYQVAQPTESQRTLMPSR